MNLRRCLHRVLCLAALLAACGAQAASLQMLAHWPADCKHAAAQHN
jgi:hypothetical protein